VDTRLSNVLLVGTGSVKSQIFLDNLSGEMMQRFKQQGVQADFTYLDKTPPSASFNFDKAKSDKYDCYLVFKSANESYLDMTKEKYSAISAGGSVIKGYGNQYVESYNVKLYSGKGNQEVLWQGELFVDFDIANERNYKQISKLFFDEFKKHRFLLN
jgi:hypothetical protein